MKSAIKLSLKMVREHLQILEGQISNCSKIKNSNCPKAEKVRNSSTTIPMKSEDNTNHPNEWHQTSNQTSDAQLV